MGLEINHNIAALNSRRHVRVNNEDLNTRVERLASGLRINNAGDDASGLVVSEGFRSQIAGMIQGVRNAEMGSNLVQVAEGALNEVSGILLRLRTLAVQAACSTANDKNRQSIEAEVTELKAEIDRISRSAIYNDQTVLNGFGNTINTDESDVFDAPDQTETGATNVRISSAAAGTYTFSDEESDGEITLGNGIVSQTINMEPLLDGSSIATGTTAVANFDRLGIQVTLAGQNVNEAHGSYADGDLNARTLIIEGGTGGSFQVGANNSVVDRVEVTIEDMSASGSFLNLNSVSLGTQLSARTAIDQLDHAFQKLAQVRGDLGTTMNRLQHTINFTDGAIEGNTASKSHLTDADMATEVTAFTRAQILGQASIAMLSQSNAQSSQQVLTLLE